MNILDDVLMKQIREKESELKFHKEKLDSLSKGSLCTQRVGNSIYMYRKWRDGKVIRSEYLGKFGTKNATNAIEEINEYKLLNERIKKEEEELKELKKAYKLILFKTKLD